MALFDLFRAKLSFLPPSDLLAPIRPVFGRKILTDSKHRRLEPNFKILSGKTEQKNGKSFKHSSDANRHGQTSEPHTC